MANCCPPGASAGTAGAAEAATHGAFHDKTGGALAETDTAGRKIH